MVFCVIVNSGEELEKNFLFSEHALDPHDSAKELWRHDHGKEHSLYIVKSIVYIFSLLVLSASLCFYPSFALRVFFDFPSLRGFF